ncbi:MAG TPA: saccharopine dehydrogenase, partial [Bacteroidetes bacterium]|nr:saccharopine dehydrogenase [Bacteroidota bacterium]
MNSRKKITVLGVGLVGQAIVTDLAARFQVTAVDCDPKRLERLQNLSDVIPQQADLSKPGILEHIIGDADLVVGALPGYMGFGIVRDVIRAGKNMVDISFFPQDPFPLNKPAEEAGVSVVMDCGVAPGMGNIILGYHQAQMQVERYECLVGGLPFKREWPYQYKAVFSPVDVIEEYVRPARYVENG